MTTTSTATRPADLAQLNAVAERAAASAAEASAKASAAYAEAQLAGERARLEQDARFCRWAEATIAAAPAEERRLIAATDAARIAFEQGIALGESDYPARYMAWSDAAGQIFHSRQYIQNLRGHLHLRRPGEHAAPDAGRSGGHDSRVTVPAFIDALNRTVAQAVATRIGDHEAALQDTLNRALRGEVDDA
jgi:pyruvate/2-oxoglutarate dehydrogenase complex dihydrolipoamide acyltransferase (E2) component